MFSFSSKHVVQVIIVPLWAYFILLFEHQAGNDLVNIINGLLCYISHDVILHYKRKDYNWPDIIEDAITYP